MIALRFTPADLEAAQVWKCSCGHASLAAIAGMTLPEARGCFDQLVGYVNPSMMYDALERACLRFKGYALGGRTTKLDFPRFGLARIQWDGPWTEPGVPIAARYVHTHWIATDRRQFPCDVFDINWMDRGGWCAKSQWFEIADKIIASIPRADGWYVTHQIEIDPATVRVPA